MNTILALMIASLCVLLFVTILIYISGETGIKSFIMLGVAGFIITIVCFLKIIDIQFLHMSFFLLIEKKVLLIGALVVFFALYKYGKNEDGKKNTSFDILILSSMSLFSIIELFLVYNNITFDLIFGIGSFIGSLFIYYFLRKSIIGKHIAGFSCMFLGVVYIIFGINHGWEQYFYLQYLLNAVIFILIGLGMTISYFEEIKIQSTISENNFRTALEASKGGLWQYDILNYIISLPKEMVEIMGLGNKETSVKLRELKQYIHKDDLEKFKSSFNISMLGNLKYYNEEFRIKIQSDEYKYFLFKGKILLNGSGKPVKIVGINTDITERKDKEEDMYNLAYYDKGTLLPNANYFEKEFFKTINNRKYFSVFSIGLIGLENIIDALGHGSGDEFLKTVISNTRKHIPEGGIIVRFEENRFLGVVYNNNYKRLKIISNKILDNINESKIITNNQFNVKPVIGISLFPQDGKDPMQVAENANLAMHKSLEEGKDYKFFNHLIKEDMENKIQLKKLLYEAVEKEEFKVFYQLQIDGNINQFIGVEALVRWNHPERGVITPGQFIPIAEETGLIVNIGEIVLREACYTGKRLHDKGRKSFCVSVNISPIQLGNDNFDKIVKEILRKTEFDPNYLILEMSENVFVESMEEYKKTLAILRNIGVKIAIDDFGKGAVPLSFLLNNPIDILKIDRSFVFGMLECPKKVALIDSMIGIAKKLNLKVVVQGIETEEQLNVIEKLGCDSMQGYLFSKPGVNIERHLV